MYIECPICTNLVYCVYDKQRKEYVGVCEICGQKVTYANNK